MSTISPLDCAQRKKRAKSIRDAVYLAETYRGRLTGKGGKVESSKRVGMRGKARYIYVCKVYENDFISTRHTFTIYIYVSNVPMCSSVQLRR